MATVLKNKDDEETMEETETEVNVNNFHDDLIPDNGDTGGETENNTENTQADADGKTTADVADARDTADAADAEGDSATDAADAAEADVQDAEEENENDEAEDIPLLAVEGDLSVEQRLELYETAVRLDKDGRKNLALKCYLKCLKGLEEANGFVSLPHCLRNVADIYYEKEEFEKAIQFIQAEKMFYETALVDTSTFQHKLEREQRAASEGEELGGGIGSDQVTENPELHRANEYENLAQLCLEKEQPQLALEYQAKATKIRQQIYGADHPLTAKSLDVFTAIYGEVGKQQYSESMQKLNTPIPETVDMGTEIDPDRLHTGVRQRKAKPETGEAAGDNIVQQAEEEEEGEAEETDPELREQEEWISKMLLWILFFLCIIALSGIVFYLYCKINVSSKSCTAWKSDLHYYYMRFKYYYYHYTSSPDATYG